MGYPHGVLQVFRLPLNSSYKQLESVTSPQSFLTFLLFSIDIDNNSLLLFIIIAEHSAPWLLINQLLMKRTKCNQTEISHIKLEAIKIGFICWQYECNQKGKSSLNYTQYGWK